jgi:DNA repair exonuclease SbcCD ATPase subunit
LKTKYKDKKRLFQSLREFCFISVKALEKLKRQLAEAEAELEARKKPPEDAGPRVVNEGLVIDEWVRS